MIERTEPVEYRGWRYNYLSSRPATRVWKGERYGVTVSSSTEEGVKMLIDRRIKDRPGTGGA